MKIDISKAREKDFVYIQEKIEKYVLDSTKIDWRQFFVAKIEDKVITFARVIDYGDFFEIASLGVDYYYRRKGIGRQMVSFLIKEARRLDSEKPIYGVTHVPKFMGSCGFVPVESGYPDCLEYKRKHLCRLPASKIKIMKWKEKSA